MLPSIGRLPKTRKKNETLEVDNLLNILLAFAIRFQTVSQIEKGGFPCNILEFALRTQLKDLVVC